MSFFLVFNKFFLFLFQMFQKETRTEAEEIHEATSESEEDGDTDGGEEGSGSEGSGGGSNSGDQDGGEE
jgi:hypothetical protein